MGENVTIKRLDGPDKVRLRPSVFFESDTIKGVVQAIKNILEIFIVEAYSGNNSKLLVTINKDNSVEVKSYDRGFLMDDEIIDEKPAWHYDFCELYTSSFEKRKDRSDVYDFALSDVCHSYHSFYLSEKEKSIIEGLHMLDVACVQYASEFMHISSVRDGIKKSLDFKSGYSVSELQKSVSDDKTHTYIHFKLDEKIFEDVTVPYDEIRNFLKDASITISGFETELVDLRTGLCDAFQFRDGIESYATSLLTEQELTTPLFLKEITAKGKDKYNRIEYDATVSIALAFVFDKPQTTCYHNCKCIQYGGNHLKKAKEAIQRNVELRFYSDIRNNLPTDICDDFEKLTVDDVFQSLVLLIKTNSNNRATCWENATKKAITNVMIADMTYDIFNSKDFEDYLYTNYDEILKILRTRIIRQNNM